VVAIIAVFEIIARKEMRRLRRAMRRDKAWATVQFAMKSRTPGVKPSFIDVATIRACRTG